MTVRAWLFQPRFDPRDGARAEQRLRGAAGSRATIACTSRDHCALVVSTSSVPSSRKTDVTRSSAGPTAACHAKATLPWDSGASRSRSTSAPGMARQEVPSDRSYHCGSTASSLIADDRQIFLTYESAIAVRLILASASPRRAELLRSARVRILDARCRRRRRGQARRERRRCTCARLAAEKSVAATGRPAEAGRYEEQAGRYEEIVLGADTAVVVDGEILGKPRRRGRCRADVATAARACARRDYRGEPSAGRVQLGRVETTRGRVRTVTEADIAWHVASGEGRDKAGGYAIQGLASRFIPRNPRLIFQCGRAADCDRS